MAGPFHWLISKQQNPNAFFTFHVPEYRRQNRLFYQLQIFNEPCEESRNSGGFHVSPSSSTVLELYFMSIKFSKESKPLCCHVGNLPKSENISSQTMRSSTCFCRIVRKCWLCDTKLCFWWAIVEIKYIGWKVLMHRLKDFKPGSG